MPERDVLDSGSLSQESWVVLRTVCAGIGGAAMVIAAIMAFFALRRMAIKQFGGMSGDLAGFSIQMSELIMLTAYVFVTKAVNI